VNALADGDPKNARHTNLNDSSELQNDPTDDTDAISISARPLPGMIGMSALLAVPLGFGALLFFGVKPVMWLPTPLRLAPYSILAGCLVELVYQKWKHVRIKDAILPIVMTGILAGVFGIVAFYGLLIITAGGLVH
jgi:hypothetical protein